MDDALPLAEEIPGDKKLEGLWPCPTCKAVFAVHPAAREYMRKTGYCSFVCHALCDCPVPIDPDTHWR